MPKQRTSKPRKPPSTPLPDAVRTAPIVVMKTRDVIIQLEEWLAIAKGESSLRYGNISDLVFKIQQEVEGWVEELEAL